MSNNFFPPRKSCRLWDKVEKYCGVAQATDDNIIQRLRIACRMTKATNTHSEYATPTGFPRQKVTWKCLNATLYVQCLSYFFKNWYDSVHHLIYSFPFLEVMILDLKQKKSPLKLILGKETCLSEEALLFCSYQLSVASLHLFWQAVDLCLG
jgi:hypothetical protein